MLLRRPRLALAFASLTILATSCGMDHAPDGLGRTRKGPGATVRFDLSHQPLPDIPLPNDTATWPDPTSRTGLRLNASLVAPTQIEQKARQHFSEMEGWGTFAPITVSFDLDRSDPMYRAYDGTAIDLFNVQARHIGDDYDFSNDAVYLVNLETGVPVALDLGAGNFNYTLKRLDRYWANDTRATERNLLFETIDETKKGAITPSTFAPQDDTDFDGVLDRPNLDTFNACPDPDPVCDNRADPASNTDACAQTRRSRDRCVADHLLTWYERETDTLILRPMLPLDEMTRYAVVITDRLLDGRGNPVKSPFDLVYHAAMQTTAERVLAIVNDSTKKAYFGDIAGTGLDHVAFTWSFTTQPTVDDMKRLRDGLYGKGPFARWAAEYPPHFEVERTVGLTAGLTQGKTDDPGWQSSADAQSYGCAKKVNNLYVIKYDDIRDQIRQLVTGGFGLSPGPTSELLLKSFESIDHLVVGAYKSPFLLEGGPKSADPNAAFRVNFQSGEAEETPDTVQFLLVVPKETAAHKQPFNVDIYGHGYTGNFTELLLYAGNMAQQGLATVGINAMGHGLAFDNPVTALAAQGLFKGGCAAPFYDALTMTRARDLNNDGIPDSGGDFWSSYLFHTRDGVRQSVLDHLQLVRILRSFGTASGQVLCRNEKTGWQNFATEPCDANKDGQPDIAGDFDGDGRADVGGPGATYGTWGESLGGILSGVHGAVDPFVSAAVPGSGGAGLTDIGVRSFQGGVIEAVLLRVWGPLLVTVPGASRTACDVAGGADGCTLCAADQMSLRWVMPDLNGTGEVEIGCFSLDQVANKTVFANDPKTNGFRCVSTGADGRMRIGVPASIGDKVQINFYDGPHQVKDYKSCAALFPSDTKPSLTVNTWGKGPVGNGAPNAVESEKCESESCATFQGHFFGEGEPLTAPAEGYGLIRQTPDLRRFLQLAQAALEPGDPASFAPYYSIKTMKDPSGAPIPKRAVLTLNTIGDMNVPLNAGIAFARATGALPFLRPDQAALYPEYADYVTPMGLFQTLGYKTPNELLIENGVIEGIAALARHPAGPQCAASANASYPGGVFPLADGGTKACFPAGCTAQTEMSDATRVCYEGSHCDTAAGQCVPDELGQTTCDEALFDADDLDEGSARYFEQNLPEPLRLARFTRAATPETLADVWAPRLKGEPYGVDAAWKAEHGKPLTALLDAYIVPQGVHTFTNGDPCQGFDAGTYLTNLTARFFATGGADLYYLSHPATHRCMATDITTCDLP